MTANTIAMMSGIVSATTEPGRTPRLTKLTARMIATACHSEAMKSLIERSTVYRLVGNQERLDAERQVGPDRCHLRPDVAPRARMSPPSRIAMARPIAGGR